MISLTFYLEVPAAPKGKPRPSRICPSGRSAV